MVDKYKIKRDLIREYFEKEQYFQASVECNKYLEFLTNNSFNIEDNREDIWFAQHMSAYSQYKSGNIEIALDMVLNSFYTIQHHNKVQALFSLWLQAECYKKLKDIKNAVKIYRMICNDYKAQGLFKMFYANLFEIAKITNKVYSAERIFKAYLNCYNAVGITIYKEEDFEDESVKTMVKDIINMYLAKKLKQRAVKLINSVPNKVLRKELMKNLLAA